MRKRIPNFILPVLCGAFLLIFALALLVTPQKEYSADENRNLATAPALTADALLDGSYTRGLGDYFADQFPLRSSFVRLKTICEQLLFKGENNGVIFGKDGYLIPRPEYTDAQYEVLRRNLGAMASFAELLTDSAATEDIPLYLTPVPRSVDVNRAYLPALYDTAAADAAWEVYHDRTNALSLTSIDLYAPLLDAADNGSQVWFKTDHHWTSEGAYLAYVALGDVLGYTPHDRADFTLETVSEDFLGTTYSSAGLTAQGSDTITLWRYDDDRDYRTEIWEDGKVVRVLQGFYDTEALAGKDQYSVFLGGTHAHIRVEPPTAQELPTLLLIKDSYAQSLAPFLARHYRLILIDPRSYRETGAQPSVSTLIANEQPDAVLLLCGIDTLCGDMDLRTLLLQRK
ncbi:MAG: hypothetical protein IJW40_09280 [Clostridia bacterium]|nr:hypothetical protein [Clostridia bacterium]